MCIQLERLTPNSCNMVTGGEFEWFSLNNPITDGLEIGILTENTSEACTGKTQKHPSLGSAPEVGHSTANPHPVQPPQNTGGKSPPQGTALLFGGF